MVRENSFSDSDGRSLTPDLEEENDFIGPSSSAASPAVGQTSPTKPIFDFSPQRDLSTSVEAAAAPARGSLSPRDNVNRPGLPDTDTLSAPAVLPSQGQSIAKERFKLSVRKVIHMNRGSSAMSFGRISAGAEPGIDPRRSSAFLNYGHLRQRCTVEVIDYSAVRSSFGRMHNKGFVQFMEDPRASKREPWVKVRWINIGGISWDVIAALAIKFGTADRLLGIVAAESSYIQIYIRLLWKTSCTSVDSSRALNRITI